VLGTLRQALARAEALDLDDAKTSSDATKGAGRVLGDKLDALAKVAPPPFRDHLGRSIDAACVS
jgi:hypothetical protein